MPFYNVALYADRVEQAVRDGRPLRIVLAVEDARLEREARLAGEAAERNRKAAALGMEDSPCI